VAILGEAPGVEEDEAGEPFVGPSGRLLRKTLARVGFDVDLLAFWNSVSCYPARTPTDDELASCRGNLIAQLVLIQPRWVLVTGAVPLRALGRRGGITEARGTPWDRLLIDGGRRTYFPVWHPARVLRNRALYAGWRRDLAEFREMTESD
jgi:DNA polymerase